MRPNKPLVLLSLLFLGLLVGLVTPLPTVHQFDIIISHTLQVWQPQWFAHLAQFVSLAEFSIIPITAALIAIFIYHRRYHWALLTLVIAFSWLPDRLLKFAFDLPCPNPTQVQQINTPEIISTVKQFLPLPSPFFTPSACYPSGHVFEFVAFFGFLYLIIDQVIRHRLMIRLIKLISLTLILTIGISRISIGAHWFTDVIGGYLFGTAWLILLTSVIPTTCHTLATPSLTVDEE